MKRLILAAILGGISAIAVGIEPIQFEPRPGRNEFSGRLIVRPKQIENQMEKGRSFKEAYVAHEAAARSIQNLKVGYAAETDEYIIAVPRGKTEGILAAELMATGRYEYVEPDWIVYPSLLPNDPLLAQQWHLPKIGSPLAWDMFTGMNTVIIALTDTGVRLDHEDFQGSLVPGYNAVNGVAQANGGQVGDLNGHGTHTAGIAAAVANNLKGVSGIGWNFKIMPIRVSNTAGGSSSLSTLTNGARWAADNGARVINTSYSGVDNNSVETTGQYIRNTRNAFYCWAAGNDARWLTLNMPHVTVVGSTDPNDAKAGSSAWGPTVDVFAPGVNILSTYYQHPSSYAFMSGTSMASPVIAGVAGMIAAANPSLSAGQIETMIFNTALDLGPAGRDDWWGWGRVRLREALQATYSTAEFAPTAYNIIKGTYISGGVNEVRARDNQHLVVRLRPRLGAGDRYVVETEYETTTTNHLASQLEVRLKGYVEAANVVQTLSLWDWNLNTYVSIASGMAPQTNTESANSAPTPARFIQNGTGRVRIKISHEPLVSMSQFNLWNTYTDYVAVRTPSL